MNRVGGKTLRPEAQKILDAIDQLYKDVSVSPAQVARELTAIIKRCSVRRFVRNCNNETCGKLFITSAYQRQYCSTRCRNTRAHRNMRQRNKLKWSKPEK